MRNYQTIRECADQFPQRVPSGVQFVWVRAIFLSLGSSVIHDFIDYGEKPIRLDLRIIQFSMVVLFAHMFYTLVRLQAILAVLFATFAGFGIAMSVSSIIVEFLRWRRRRNTRSAQSRVLQAVPQPGQYPRTMIPPRLDPFYGHQTELTSPGPHQWS
ncbi:uncharacterized protein LOC104421667 [Eucalyptus grandis]|uniref:uncharacterized protein LOC104421667 n=1 Tax=Eucalyptus grandis TaxID=71139 RepID=UPI00192EF4E7|nr:uncharacterized protein LOC104421667 [Eucalyptus grandis]